VTSQPYDAAGRSEKVMARVTAVVVVVLLTLLTQIGGLVMLLVWGLSRLALPRAMGAWLRAAINALLFVIAYAAISALVVPPLAALAARVPLPCRAQPDRAFAAGSVLICALNRHYVVPDLVVVLNELSGEIERAFPGTTTLFLDANFPFLNRFPLLPHLSHSDGRKLDLAFYYADAEGRYLPAVTRSPIGYWAFEQPSASDASPCAARSWLSLRWDLDFLQDKFPDRVLEPRRTSAALQWLLSEGSRFKVDRVFVEPYLAARLGVASPALGFQGCRAARHDDHIHIQTRR
jgi:hypothetical protein